MEQTLTEGHYIFNPMCTHLFSDSNPSIREHLGENCGIYVHSRVRTTHGWVNNNKLEIA